jgi:hypothetical protein
VRNLDSSHTFSFLPTIIISPTSGTDPSFSLLPSLHTMNGATKSQIGAYRAHVRILLQSQRCKIYLHQFNQLFTQQFIEKNSSLFLDEGHEAWINPRLLQSFLAANSTRNGVSASVLVLEVVTHDNQYSRRHGQIHLTRTLKSMRATSPQQFIRYSTTFSTEYPLILSEN